MDDTTHKDLSYITSSNSERNSPRLLWYDYACILVMFSISSGFGIYFGCFGNKQSTANEYLLGGKRMSVIPVTVSLLISHTAGSVLLGLPADAYTFGASYFIGAFTTVIVAIITSVSYFPVYHKVQVTSIYEYLGLRFDNRVKKFATLLLTLGMLIYLPIVMYVSSLSFSAVSGIDSHIINFVFSAVCIFYTSLGGIKALIWIDTIQFILTYGIVFFLMGKGIYDLGGILNFWNSDAVQTRLDFLDWSFDITKRDTVWALFLGHIGHWMARSTIDPSTIQKLLSIPSYKDANWVIILYGICLMILKSVCVLIGLVLSATYANCDPVATKQIHKNDQMLPYHVMNVAKHMPGILGLFTAGITTASLSTLSSILNSTSGTIYAIFLKKPLEKKGYKQEGITLKILVVIIGVLSTLMVYIIERMGEIVTLAIGLVGIAYGPLLGIFSLGLFFPTANPKGTLYGMITSFIVMCVIVAGNSYYKMMKKIVYPHKKVSVDSCDFFVNTTITSNLIEKVMNPRTDEDIFPLFKISFYWFTLFGCIICIIMGLIFSWMTGNNYPQVSKKFLSPVIYPFLSKNRNENGTVYRTVEDARKELSTADDERDENLK